MFIFTLFVVPQKVLEEISTQKEVEVIYWHFTSKRTKLPMIVFQYSIWTINWWKRSRIIIMKVEMHGQLIIPFSNDTNGDLFSTTKHRVHSC